ncbi:MAG: phosphonate ABC transporter ATP-binding protein [Chloroflexota bacterium]
MIVEAADVAKSYAGGAVALRNVSLRVGPGEVVGLLGPSGAGKTTLLRLLGAAIWPTGGSLRVLGRDVRTLRGAQLRAHRRRVSTIAQQHSLVPRLTALQNVLLGRAGGRPLWQAMFAAIAPRDLDRADAFRELAALGIGEQLDRPVDHLSGGQQQRVAVARALLQDGDLIIADEPVASVDQETAEVILDVLRRVAMDDGRTVVVSLHQRALATRYCTRLVTLERGEVMYDGPAHAYVN